MDEDNFHELAEDALASLQLTLEEFVEDAEIPDADVEYGVSYPVAPISRIACPHCQYCSFGWQHVSGAGGIHRRGLYPFAYFL